MGYMLETAKLAWRNQHTPVSSDFDDIYFSEENGLEESRYVYLQQNHLAARFAQCTEAHFIIAETGFGTGLNFLLAAQLWQQQESATAGKKLFYISTEKYPLSKPDLDLSLQTWPELYPLRQQLLAQYPDAIKGLHYIEFDNICLILLLGDSTDGLNTLIENPHASVQYPTQRAVDAWFLDGFAPSKNASMWQPELFQQIAKLSHRGTTLASFTAAGFVKRSLQSVGFKVTKVAGYGKKREMISAEFIGLPLADCDTEPCVRDKKYPAFWPLYRSQQSHKVQSALVIGAGIAGCTTARALAEAGIQVILIDALAQPLAAASGNPQAVLYPKLAANRNAFAEFNLSSFLYALRYYRREEFAAAFINCGLLQLLDDKEIATAEKLLASLAGNRDLVKMLDASSASSIAGTTISQQALHYEQSGYIDTQALAQSIIQHPNIQWQGNSQIDNITSIAGARTTWQAASAEQIFQADAVIVCAAEASKKLLAEQKFNSKNIRGQISSFNSAALPQLRSVVCHNGYICPSATAQSDYFCGATFDLHEQSRSLNAASQSYNFQQLAQALPDFSHLALQSQALAGRVEFRCAASDYMPIVGPVANVEAFRRDYGAYNKNAKAHIPQLGNYQPGLFINMAYGSRAYACAPINAALIRAYLLEEPYPLDFQQVKAMNPARFLIHQLAGKHVKQ